MAVVEWAPPQLEQEGQHLSPFPCLQVVHETGWDLTMCRPLHLAQTSLFVWHQVAWCPHIWHTEHMAMLFFGTHRRQVRLPQLEKKTVVFIKARPRSEEHTSELQSRP